MPTATMFVTEMQFGASPIKLSRAMDELNGTQTFRCRWRPAR